MLGRMDYQKPKSAFKQITVKSPKLKSLILETMKTISSVVGGTLGPGGQPVIIERGDPNIPPSITKDGVTVFKALGLPGAEEHAILEVARDAASRTATEAGDGTTTSTILAEALVRNIYGYCERNPTVSPQKVVRRLEELFKTVVEPGVRGLATKVTLNTERDRALLRHVAQVSANGDEDLATAVLECYDITGDAGNIAIVESVGASRYQVEKINGYPIESGWDNSCMKFFDKFINDLSTGATILDKPVFLLYHGKLTEIQTISNLMRHIGEEWQQDPERYDAQTGEYTNANIVICATGYSESVIANLATNFGLKNTINVFPLLAPLSPQANGQLMLLQDLSAITSAKVFDPLSAPIERGSLEDLGPGVESFQCGRTKSVVLGYTDASLLEARVEEVERMVLSPESQLDELLLKNRAAALSGGIAKLRVWGSSNGELKEKKDRAEDGCCAVKGAIKAGVLPGGGWTLLKLNALLSNNFDDKVSLMLAEALMEPVFRLQSNCGLTEDEGNDIITELMSSNVADYVYDYQEHKYVNAFESGILDSVPAVLEAIRSSLSVASQLGTCGGIVVYGRDNEIDRKEAIDAANWEREAGINEADLRP